MDLLKREMERKKKAVEEAKKKKGSARFLKASELRRLQEEEEDERDDKRKRPLDDEDKLEKDEKEEDSSKKQRKQETNETDEEAASSNTKNLSEAEIINRFRELGLPIRLFGETNRMPRLKLAEKEHAASALKQTEQDEFRLKMGHGIRNPFLEKEKQEHAVAVIQKDLTTTPSKAVNDTEKRTEKKSRDEDDNDKDDPHKRVYRHFKGLLKQWEADLNARDDAAKQTVAGRNETKTLKQCKDYIRPLFQLCKRRQLEPNMMNKLVEIVDYCEEGEFVKAHDAYMDVAIGRAAWPIGVTMVGIHARTGRSKIESSNVAHVMNSELQRKYLTSVKRLLTYHQSKRTDVDPSKKVVN